MASLGTIATVASLAGTAVSAAGTIATGQAEAANFAAQQQQLQAQGRAEEQAAEFEAKQLDIKAQQEEAAAQQEAQQLRRRKRLALSTLQARSAGSGFSVTDPTSLALADEIARFGTLQAETAQFGGESRAAGLRSSAQARRFTGSSARFARAAEARAAGRSASAARTGSAFRAGGTILGGISTMANKFARRRSRGVSSAGTNLRFG